MQSLCLYLSFELVSAGAVAGAVSDVFTADWAKRCEIEEATFFLFDTTSCVPVLTRGFVDRKMQDAISQFMRTVVAL